MQSIIIIIIIIIIIAAFLPFSFPLLNILKKHLNVYVLLCMTVLDSGKIKRENIVSGLGLSEQ
jgi:hypothetical protein